MIMKYKEDLIFKRNSRVIAQTLAFNPQHLALGIFEIRLLLARNKYFPHPVMTVNNSISIFV